MQLDARGEGASMGFQAASSTVFKGLQAAVSSVWLESEVHPERLQVFCIVTHR